MKPQSIVLTVAGMCFGVIVGWLLANLDSERAASARVTQTAPPRPAAAAGNTQQPAVLDEARVQALTTLIEQDPGNARAAVELGTVYFEADRFEDAMTWFEEGLRIDPNNVDASTQLGMAYFVMRGADQALEQLDRSLAISPNDPRTLLSKGIVLWRGKDDLQGAAAAWQQLVDAAPNSAEAQAARQGLTALSAAGPGGDARP